MWNHARWATRTAMADADAHIHPLRFSWPIPPATGLTDWLKAASRPAHCHCVQRRFMCWSGTLPAQATAAAAAAHTSEADHCHCHCHSDSPAKSPLSTHRQPAADAPSQSIALPILVIGIRAHECRRRHAEHSGDERQCSSHTASAMGAQTQTAAAIQGRTQSGQRREKRRGGAGSVRMRVDP